MAIKSAMTEEDYKLLNDAYYGEGGFLDGTYITPHKREDTNSDPKSSYSIRKAVSYYQNYIQPVVDSHINAVFSAEPAREYVDKNGYFEKFTEDADGCGNSLNRVMKEKGTAAKLKAVTLIIVDNYKSIPEDVQSALDSRAFPYVFSVDPELFSLDDFLFEKKNIVQVGYYEDPVVIDNKTYKQKRIWDIQKSALWRQSEQDSKMIWGLVEESYHNLKILPCFFFNSTANLDNKKIPTSQFLHPARIARALFNIASEIREIQRNQTFSILTMPTSGVSDDGAGLTIGTNNLLEFPHDATNVPAFIAPPDGPLNALLEYTKELINEIYRMSCVSYTQQYASTQQSGESKRWTFHVTRQVLEDFAVSCEECERKIASIFGKYIQHDLQFKVAYSRKYGADDIDADIERTDVVLKMDLPDAVKIEVIKNFVKSYFAENEDDTVDMLFKKIDEYAIELEAEKQMEPEDQEGMMNDDETGSQRDTTNQE